MEIKERINNTECPVAYALNLIGGKWHFQIIWSLHKKPVQRYNELKRRVDGITNMMLSQSLKELEQYGLISRTQFPEIPPRVEYSLTEEGMALRPIIKELARWGAKQMASQEE